jgi:hypothetical protein
MKCGLYGLCFDDVRDQVRWLPAPCVLGIYIYKKKIYCYFGLGKAGLLHHWSNSHFLPSPDCAPLSSLATTTPFQNFTKTTTYRTTSVQEQASSPLSLLLSKRRSKTQTFTDLSLHCYHCRKTLQIRVGKGHTSERPVSTCLIFINFV